MGKRKSPEQKAAEALRYQAADAAVHWSDFEPLFDDPNQAIRAAAAHNRAADESVLMRFAGDRFWGTRIEVAKHPNVTERVLRSLLADKPSERGVVDHEARRRLSEMGLDPEAPPA